MKENLDKKVSEFIRQFNIIEKNNSVLLGVSGGPDSIFMLYILNKLKNEMNFSIAVATFNHKLRSEAKEESEFVKEICNKMKVQFFYGEGNVEKSARKEKISIEEAARKERFKFLFKIKKEHKFDKIALAHNKDDFVETILIHIAKGSGLKGLTGIKPISFSGIVHPIVNIERREIEKYLSQRSIPFKTDLTNYSLNYLRNRIRYQIVPLFSSVNKNFKEKIFDMGVLISDENTFLSEISEKDKEIIQTNNKFSLKLFLALPIFEQRRIIKSLLGEEASFQRIENIIAFLRGDTNRMSLFGNLFLVKSDAFFYVQENRSIPFSFNKIYKVNIVGKTEIKEIGIEISTEILKEFNELKFGRHSTTFDLNKLPLPLSIRFRQRGDRIILESGAKKIQDLFVDKKIPAEKRPYIPLLTDAKGNIIWVVGIRRSALYKLSKVTKTAIFIRANFIKKQFML